MAVAIVWFLSIRYFRKLAEAKFFVIRQIEKDLPIAAFELEWSKFKEEGKWRVSLTHLEMSIPLMVSLLSAGYILFLSVG